MARVGGVFFFFATCTCGEECGEGGGEHEREAAYDKANGGERGWVVCIWFACLLFIMQAEGLSLVMREASRWPFGRRLSVALDVHFSSINSVFTLQIGPDTSVYMSHIYSNLAATRSCILPSFLGVWTLPVGLGWGG